MATLESDHLILRLADPDLVRLAQQSPEVLDHLPRVCTDVLRHVLNLQLHLQTQTDSVSLVSRLEGLETALQRVQTHVERQLDHAVDHIKGAVHDASLTTFHSIQAQHQVLVDRVADLGRLLHEPSGALQGTVHTAVAEAVQRVVTELPQQVAAVVAHVQENPHADVIQTELHRITATLACTNTMQGQFSTEVNQALGVVQQTVRDIVTQVRGLHDKHTRTQTVSAVKGGAGEDDMYTRLERILDKNEYEVIRTGQDKTRSADFRVKRLRYTDTLVEVKKYDTTKVPEAETGKFLRDMEQHNCHGICVAAGSLGFARYNSFTCTLEPGQRLAIFIAWQDNMEYVLRDVIGFIHQFDQHRTHQDRVGVTLTERDTINITHLVQDWMRRLKDIKQHADAISQAVTNFSFNGLLAVIRGNTTAAPDVNRPLETDEAHIQQLMRGAPKQTPGLTNPHDGRSVMMQCPHGGCFYKCRGGAALTKHLKQCQRGNVAVAAIQGTVLPSGTLESEIH